MIIAYKAQTLNFSENINELMCQLDKKISLIAEDKLNASRYGARTCEHPEYTILVIYKDILKLKANNFECLREYLIDDIINIIKQYLTSGKVQKFKVSSNIPVSEIDKEIKVNGVNISVIHKNYGDYIVNNSVSNRYVTEADNWEKTDW